MYKYSWKTALVTLGLTGVGHTAMAVASHSRDKALADVPKNDSVKEAAGSIDSLDVDSIQATVKELNSKVNGLEESMGKANEALQSLPPDLTYAVIGVAIFALLLALILLAIIRSKAAHYANNIKGLRKDLDHQRNLLENLNRRLNDIQETSDKYTLVKERYPGNIAYPQPVVSMRPEPVLAPARTYAAPVMPEAQIDPLKKLNEKCSEFAKEYNRIQSIQGLEAKTAKQDFQRKYGLCGFVCVNADDRVNHPEIPPKFTASESLVDASIWGFQFDAYYLVAPNPRQYVGNDHNYGGMKELFKSNFQQGCTYSKINLNKPAIMTQDLQTIWKQGNLQLS